MKVKLYQSESWLRLKYLTERLSEKEIAALAGCDQTTINKYLRLYKIKKSR